ncbi:MAG: RDD family protein [Capsulimonadaceae bacterium]
MSREILVVTPENIEIEYELAGVGTRLMANALDGILQALAFIVLIVIFGLIMFVLSVFSANAYAHVRVFSEGVYLAAGSIAFFLLFWGYFIYYEIVRNGQTPGKSHLGLRVIRTGGYPISSYAAITRNLLRVIDGIPMVVGLVYAYYLVTKLGSTQPDIGGPALVAVCLLMTLCFLLFTPRYQRLGDLIAGTMVVKQRAPRVPSLEALAPPPRVLPEHLAPYALKDIGRHVYEMTVPEYRAIRHAIDRRWSLPLDVQQTAAMRLAVPLMKRLGITPPPGVRQVNYADLLEYLAVAFEQYRGVK